MTVCYKYKEEDMATRVKGSQESLALFLQLFWDYVKLKLQHLFHKWKTYYFNSGSKARILALNFCAVLSLMSIIFPDTTPPKILLKEMFYLKVRKQIWLRWLEGGKKAILKKNEWIKYMEHKNIGSIN